jgi:plastocyanin
MIRELRLWVAAPHDTKDISRNRPAFGGSPGPLRLRQRRRHYGRRNRIGDDRKHLDDLRTLRRRSCGQSGRKARTLGQVDISNFEYNPDPVRVEAGGKVIWLNEDSISHTATADDGSFDTGEIEEGKLKSETFKQPGTYAYHCEIHPQMHGTIEVVEKE